MPEPEFRVRLGVVYLYAWTIATLTVLFAKGPEILQFFFQFAIGVFT